MPRSPDDVTRGRDLTTTDFQGAARDIARDLVGSLLLNHGTDATGADGATGVESAGPVGGLIVETEAYVNAVDPACHLTAGRTPRTESFFSGPGTLYVYTIHGHHALNFITTLDGHPEGILVRAIEPTHGLDVMAERRGFDVEEITLLASGPGRLTQALGVTKAEFDDRPLADTSLTISETDWNPEVETTGRIGVTSARDWPLRFVAREVGTADLHEHGVHKSPEEIRAAHQKSPISEDSDAATRVSRYVSKPAPAVDLDYAAVEAAYERLLQDDLPTVDDPRRP